MLNTLSRVGISLSFVAGIALLAAPNSSEATDSQRVLAAFDAPVTLYNGTGSPNGQGFTYITLLGSQATQVGANLDTLARNSDYAGFTANAMPALDRQAGFSLQFSIRLNAENHAGSDKNGDGIDDRAGFSVILLANDARGIELGFWPDRVWAQGDGSATPPNTGALFSQAEGAAFATTADTRYDLAIQGDSYTLRSGTTTILTGPIRDYSAATGSFSEVYRMKNFLFFGDDTTSARASTDFVGPIVVSPLAPPTTTPTPVPTVTSTATATPGVQPALYLPITTKP